MTDVGYRRTVDNQPEPPPDRRQEIRQRLDAIRGRLAELKAKRENPAARGTISERNAAAQQHMAASQAAAQRALAATVSAFLRAADAHQRLAREYERAATAKPGDDPELDQRAAFHRAAAEADMQRANELRSLLRKRTNQ